MDGVLVAAGDNKVIYAVDPNTGAAKWNYASPSPVFGSPVAVGKFVAYSTSDNKLIALDGATGEVALPPYSIYERIQGQIAGYDTGIVFFNGQNEMRSLDIISKKANYRRPIKFGQLPAQATPVLLGDTFYVSSGPYVVAVNASSGNRQVAVRHEDATRLHARAERDGRSRGLKGPGMPSSSIPLAEGLSGRCVAAP